MYLVVLKFVLLCIYLTALVNGKQTLWTEDDPEYGTTDLDEAQPERHCIKDSACGTHEECKYGKCVCKDGYYTKYDDIFSRCKKCPGRNEACEMVDCCYPPEDYICYFGTCKQRGHRFTISLNALMIFQMIFGIAFLFALIALTVQCFRTLLSRRKLAQMRQRRDAARTGIERNYTSQYPADPAFATRDPPPQYDSLEHIHLEKPPSYQEAIPAELSNEAVATWPYSPPAYSDTSQQGRDNPAFVTEHSEPTTTTTIPPVVDHGQTSQSVEQVNSTSDSNRQNNSLVNSQNVRHVTETANNTN